MLLEGWTCTSNTDLKQQGSFVWFLRPMYQAVSILGLLGGDTAVNKTGKVLALRGLMEKNKTKQKTEK